MKIFEAVPNISEGRDLKTIEELVKVIKEVNNLKLLDCSSDIDHNRSVFTYIGTAEAIKEGSLKLVSKAAELIDLNQHQGVHPRNGIVDVLPIIPVVDADISDAVDLAKDIGESIKERLEIPVYYYEQNAENEKYANLANLRADSYNLSKHKSAGFIAVGARNFLIAYNINLAINDLVIAKEIASRIREKQSHLAGLKALGLYLKSKDIVQISMNLTKPFEVGIEKAREAIIKEVEKNNMKASTIEEEIVGLLPEAVREEAKDLNKEIDKLLDKAKGKKNDDADA